MGNVKCHFDICVCEYLHFEFSLTIVRWQYSCLTVKFVYTSILFPSNLFICYFKFFMNRSLEEPFLVYRVTRSIMHLLKVFSRGLNTSGSDYSMHYEGDLIVHGLTFSDSMDEFITHLRNQYNFLKRQISANSLTSDWLK